jgi:hypothetical protein
VWIYTYVALAQVHKTALTLFFVYLGMTARMRESQLCIDQGEKDLNIEKEKVEQHKKDAQKYCKKYENLQDTLKTKTQSLRNEVETLKKKIPKTVPGEVIPFQFQNQLCYVEFGTEIDKQKRPSTSIEFFATRSATTDNNLFYFQLDGFYPKGGFEVENGLIKIPFARGFNTEV